SPANAEMFITRNERQTPRQIRESLAPAPELHHKRAGSRRVRFGNPVANGLQLGLSRVADHDNHRRLVSVSIASRYLASSRSNTWLKGLTRTAPTSWMPP